MDYFKETQNYYITSRYKKKQDEQIVLSCVKAQAVGNNGLKSCVLR